MRKIAFRAWDIINKKYYYNVQDVYDEEIGDSFQDILDNKTLIVEQDTGLKDFNGVEIYEGDILQDVDDNTIVGFAEYDEAFGEYDCGDNNLYECTRDCVVVGNIHEQPELLEDKWWLKSETISDTLLRGEKYAAI